MSDADALGTGADADGDPVGARRRAMVVVASTRAAAGVYEDTAGPLVAEWFAARGWACVVEVVPDGAPVGRALEAAIAAGMDAVITSGGTGVSPTDATPEMTRVLLDRELPGVAEEIRRRGTAATPLAIVSRGLAGVTGTTVIVNLPGSRGGVRDGLDVLDGVLEHLVDQLHGGDHVRTD